MSINLKENTIKNLLVLLVAGVACPFLSRSIGAIKAEEIGNFLLILSMLLVTACFANFAFTYEKSDLKTKFGRFLSHGATFVFMLLIALLLESMVLAARVLYPSFYIIILLFSLLLYLGVLLYDVWDFLRAEQ